MSIKQFIKTNRRDIDCHIVGVLTGQTPDNDTNVVGFNDEERRLWVLNDEGLYNWARSEGVEI